MRGLLSLLLPISVGECACQRERERERERELVEVAAGGVGRLQLALRN